MSTETPSAFDVAIATKLVPKTRLVDVLFFAIDAKVVASATEGGKLYLDVPVADVEWTRNARELRVVVPYQVLVLQEVGQGTPFTLATMQVVLGLDYRLQADASPTDEEIQHFVGISSLLHSWPFLRAEILSLSSKLRLPPIVLPVVVSGHASERLRVRQHPIPPGEPDEPDESSPVP